MRGDQAMPRVAGTQLARIACATHRTKVYKTLLTLVLCPIRHSEFGDWSAYEPTSAARTSTPY
jgi:hypothetical protein